MAVISAPDLVKLRSQIARSTPYLSVLQPATLLNAIVDGAHTRGSRSIAYNTGTGTAGQFATIAEGQTVWIYTDVGIQRTRVKAIAGNQTAGTITVDENGIAGSAGNIPDNTPIVILHNYEIQPIPPVIRSQIFYKFFDQVYTDQNEFTLPVAIAGPHRAGFLSAGSIVFNLDASPSYATATGAVISTYAWTCVHNGGGTTGITIASASSAVTTLTLTVAGQYWLKLVVTDDNGKTQTTYRAIFVYDANNLPYKDFTVSSGVTGDWQTGGYRTAISATGDVTLTDFPDWTLCLLWYVNIYNSTEGYVDLWDANADNVIMSGYIRRDSDNDSFSEGLGVVSFEMTTPEAVVDSIWELGSVSLETRAAPSKWWQFINTMTTGTAIHHLIRYQSYGILETCDVYGLTDDTRGVKANDFTEPTILQQANSFSFSRGIYAKIASNRLGQLYLVTDSQILNDAGRAALDTVMTITTNDVSGNVDVIRQPEPVVSFGELNGFSFNGTTSTPFISVLPGYRESSVTYILPELRGASNVSVGNQVLSSQTDSDERLGRVLAQHNNNPRELRYTTPSNYLGAFDIIPSIGWYQWGISDGTLKRDTELFNRLLICRNVTHTFDHIAGTIQTSVVFEPEAFGPDGIQGNYPTSYPTPAPVEPSWDESDAIDEGGTGPITLIDTLEIVAGASSDPWYTGFAPGSLYIFDDYPGFPNFLQYRTQIDSTAGGVLSMTGRTSIFDSDPGTQNYHYYTSGTNAMITMGFFTYWIQPPASGSGVQSSFTGNHKSIDWLTASSVIRVVPPAGNSLVAWIKDWNTGGELERTYNIGITNFGNGQHVGRVGDNYALVLYILGGIWVAALVYTDIAGDTLTLIVDENGPACDTVNVSSCVLLDDRKYGLVYTNAGDNYLTTIEVDATFSAITWGTSVPTTHGIIAVGKVNTTAVALAYIGDNGVNDQVLVGTINTSGSESPAGVIYTSAGGLTSLIPEPLSVIYNGYILVAYGDENGDYFVASASQS